MENKIIDLNLINSLNDIKCADAIRKRLVNSALFMVCYDMLSESVVDQVKRFYIIPFSDKKLYFEYEKNYQYELGKLDTNIIVVSIKWLRNMEAINDDDSELMIKYKSIRDEIAHNLSKIIFYSNYHCTIKAKDIIDMRNIINKIDSWFIREVELPISCIDINKFDTDNNKIIPGIVFILDLIIKAGLLSN